MIYITGDTHGNIDFYKIKDYFNNKYVTKEEYLIILGDAGIVWSEKEFYIGDYSSLGLTVLFIDGNHENFQLLSKFPIVNYNGAKCHRLASNVYHIMRGEIIELNDLLFLCIGGATSIDKFHRIEGISWWNDENISDDDIKNALENIKKYNYNVDYVLTHCAPSKYVKKMFGFKTDSNTEQLSKLEYYVDFKYWYFGHYHIDKNYKNFRCFYNDILEIKKYKKTNKKIDYELLVKEDDELFLRNRKTNRLTKLREEDLPEWYYKNYSYRYWYYNLKGITDIAFKGSPFDNHVSKDSVFYLHYHGKLAKDEDESPINREEWDSSSWRCDVVDFILAVDKYSSNINTSKIKAQINLVYDQYNGGNCFNNNGVNVRPFPTVNTPIYKEKFSDRVAKYEVVEGDVILSQFVELDRAKEYAEAYVKYNLKIDLIRKLIGNENYSYLEAYDTSYNHKKWVYVRMIK